MDIKTQILLLWITVGLYAASTVAFAWDLVVQQKERRFRWGVVLALLGLVPLSVALFLRWWQVGHGPYMRRYEVYSSDVWVVVLIYLLVQWRQPKLRFTGIIVMPSSFLLIGMAVLASPEIRPLPPFYGTYWLVVHILFAKLAYGFLLIGTALAIFYLVKSKTGSDQVYNRMDNDSSAAACDTNQGLLAKRWKRSGLLTYLPDLPTLHDQSYRFISFGFIMLAIMIAAGAIWANKAWGRYWSWDPVETWSLITWLLYGIYLHLVRTYGWSGRRPAWFAVGAVFVMIFALFDVGLVYNSLHSPYIR